MKNKILCFDLDNVLCITKSNNYKISKPIRKNINLVNKLFKKGFYIKIFTARYMGRNNDNIQKAKKQGYSKTYNQLKKWNLKFHRLFLTKPSFDIYVDDKSLDFRKDWDKKIKKKFID